MFETTNHIYIYICIYIYTYIVLLQIACVYLYMYHIKSYEIHMYHPKKSAQSTPHKQVVVS